MGEQIGIKKESLIDMRIALIILIVLVGIVILMAIIGRMLPVKHTASASMFFESSPDNVWNVVTNVSEWKAWRKDVKEAAMTGPSTFKEKGGQGEIDYEITGSVPGVSFVTTIITKDLPYGGEWKYLFEKEGSGCKVTITENGEVYNPLFRFLSKYVFGHDGTMKGFLKELKTRIR